MNRSSATAPSDRHWVEQACRWAVFTVPLAMTLLRLSPAAQWRDDLAVVRGLGFIPIGGEGALSTFAIELLSALPLGGRLLRAAAASALGLALASYSIYALAQRVLDADGRSPILGPCLALAAAWMATLSPAWQLEGTIAGGATLAVSLVLLALLVRPAPRPLEAREWVALGGLLALAAAENRMAALAGLLAVTVGALVLFELPSARVARLTAVSALVTSLVCLLPVLVRPWAAQSWVKLGYELARPGTGQLELTGARPGVFAAWLDDLGVVLLVLAACGVAWGLVRQRTRWLVAPLCALGLLDLGLDAKSSEVLRLGSIAAASVAAALAVHAIVRGLNHAKLPFARTARALLVVFVFTLVTLSAEDSSYVADRHARYAAEVWTDEALAALPRHAVLLVRSDALAWRLWAARVVRGDRPDVVIAPTSLLDHSAFARGFVTLEPAGAAVVRDQVVRGRPSEFALSTLADARPLMVELDPSWDQRLLEHLVPEPFWLGFSAHPLGRSDRALILGRGRDAFRRVVNVANAPTERDRPTLAVLRAESQAQAATLAALGDREAALSVLSDLRTLEVRSPFVSELERRMAQHPHGPIELAGLVR